MIYPKVPPTYRIPADQLCGGDVARPSNGCTGLVGLNLVHTAGVLQAEEPSSGEAAAACAKVVVLEEPRCADVLIS